MYGQKISKKIFGKKLGKIPPVKWVSGNYYELTGKFPDGFISYIGI